jgi:uncharacterized protein (TIGR02217 family)
MSFIETPRFPEDISIGSRGGPSFSTRIAQTQAGFEDRTILWTQTRHRYNVIYGVRDESDFDTVLDYFMAMNGRAHEFRFKDWKDYKSCDSASTVDSTDQTIGNGDGAEADFQIIKKYTVGALTYQRTIKKPVSGTVVASIDDVEQTGNWSVDTTTGVITFDDLTGSVTDATSASPIEITSAGHGLVSGDTVYLSTFTGDWSALNGARYEITKTGNDTFTVAVNGSGFTAYSGNAGQFDTVPQTGEVVKAGFEFDVPVRFDIDYMDISWEDFGLNATEIPIVEVRL